MGKGSYEKIWLSLLKSKFGSYYNQVNMAWFWIRIYKRTAKLGYFKGGFAGLVLAMANYVEEKGGLIFYNKKINEINAEQRKKSKITLDEKSYDIAIVTTPAPMVPKINNSNAIKFPKLQYLWGQTLVLELKDRFMEGYWLNILEKNWPFLVLAEHTNFVDKKYY
jgi:protoporphyrinogen oxidase